MEKKLDTQNNSCNIHSAHTFDDHPDHGKHTFFQELLHHFPYSIFSAALSIIALTLLDSKSHSVELRAYFYQLFHSFHFLHILFASTGAVVTYSRFSKNKNLIGTILIGTVSPAIFCMLSDVLLPYLSGIALGVNMKLHICFIKEINNIWPFLFMGLINGLVLRIHNSEALKVFSLGSHFIHILISSLASLFYLVSHGFSNWYPQMGFIFLFLVIAIVIPCTFSDVIIPMYFACKKDK